MDSKDQQNKEGGNSFSIQPVQETVDPKFEALKAPPGPIYIHNLPPVEGTKEEREARKEELNKK